jgi:hypothetical protein
VRRNLVLTLAAGLPLALYLRTLSCASYWLDGGEFVAAAINLDIAHPPGHPLTALYGKALSFLPLGPLPFRIALGQALAAALGTLFVFRACKIGARALGLRSASLITPIALLGAWLTALGYAIWFQAIRPEVYALQACLLFIAIERLARFQVGAARDPRPLYTAAFAVGLGLTNHHLMAFFLFPALFACAWHAARRFGYRPVWISAGLGLLALGVYLYLPLRAARHPPENLGDPRTLERIYWVVSARVYARDMGQQFPEPLSTRFAEVGVVLSQQLLSVFIPAALLGLYALLRRREGRPLGVLWLLVALPVLCIRPWLGSVRGNPDAIAYLSAGLAVAAVLASAALAVLASLLSERIASPRLWAFTCWTILLASLACQVGTRMPALDLSSFHGTDPFDEYRERVLPPRSVLVATTPQTVFRELELAATETVRPDVTLIPVPFLRYPGVADALIARSPDVRALVQSFLASERFDHPTLERLASHRPVLLELDPHTPPSSYGALLPVGLLYAVVGSRAAHAALINATALQRQVYARIYADLGNDQRETETSRQLLWLHYMDALYYTAWGQRTEAKRSLRKGAHLYPHDAQLKALAQTLDATPIGTAINVQPFLRFDVVPRAVR